MLALFESALAGKRSPGAFLFGPFCAADILYAPAVVRLSSFKVPVDRPLAAAYLGEVLAHPPVARWLREARVLPPRETY